MTGRGAGLAWTLAMHFAATVFQALVFQAQDIVKRTTLGTHREPGRPVFVATTLTLKIIKKKNKK